MEFRSADEKGKAKSPAAACDEPTQAPEAAQGAPPVRSHDDALRLAAALVVRARASPHLWDAPVQKDAPGVQQDSPPAQSHDEAMRAAAALAARARLSQHQKDPPGAQQDAPPDQSHDEAMRTAAALAARAGASPHQQDAPVQKDAPGAQQDAPPVQPPDTAALAARERLSRLREQRPRPRKDAPGAQRSDIRPRPAAYTWTKARIAVAQEIWGKELVVPGGADMIMSLVEPLKLKRKMTVLDLGVGLGGPARILAKRFGVRVTGVEWDPVLARKAKSLSRRRFWRAGKVSIQSLGETAEKISLNSFDRFIAKDCLLVLPEKDRFLRMIAAVLKDHGELLFTDFVLTAPERRTPEIEAWIAAEPETPDPWSAMDYIKLLSGLGLDMRIEDMTEQIWSEMRQSGAAFDARVERTGIDPALSEALASEASLWTRRIGLLESGELNYYRFHVARRL